MIEAKNISVQIKGKLVLNNVSVSIPKAEITAIIGPNGVGKSTLFKCLAGTQAVSDGSVLIDRKDYKNFSLKELSKRRAVLLQSAPINFPFTALEVGMLGRHTYAKESTQEENLNLVLQALEAVDGLHLKDRVFQTLSAGEQQRVQLARVLAQLWDRHDACLLLDEPTSVLDLKHQHQLLKLVQKLSLDKSFAVGIVMHDMNLVAQYAQKVVMLKDGEIFAQGMVDETLSEANIREVFDVPADVRLAV